MMILNAMLVLILTNPQAVLENVTSEFSRCSLGLDNSTGTVTMLATALLLLELAGLTGVCPSLSWLNGFTSNPHLHTEWDISRNVPASLYQHHVCKFQPGSSIILLVVVFLTKFCVGSSTARSFLGH